MERLRSAQHAVERVGEHILSVAPAWFVAGLVLHVVHQVVRTRGWFHVIQAAYPQTGGLRARDVTTAYFAGAGLNAVVPARAGDVVKVQLIRSRLPGSSWTTLFATLVPETLFETAVGATLMVWALGHGLVALPASSGAQPDHAMSLVAQHPVLAVAGVASAGGACAVLARALRERTMCILNRLRQGLAILKRPRVFLRGVVVWQVVARIIRLPSLACLLAAFALPVTLATALLVMAVQGGARIIPIAGAATGVRIAMLVSGFAVITRESVDVSRVAAFCIGASGALCVVGLITAIA